MQLNQILFQSDTCYEAHTLLKTSSTGVLHARVTLKTDKNGQVIEFKDGLPGGVNLAEAYDYLELENKETGEIIDLRLHTAAVEGNVDLALESLSKNGDVSLRMVQGATPLHWACAYGNYEVAKLLVKYGAEIDCTDDMGWTPILLAANQGHQQLIDFLEAKGAKLSGVVNGDEVHIKKNIISQQKKDGMRSNRYHHYSFAHHMLPKLFFDNPIKFIRNICADKENLLKLWWKCAHICLERNDEKISGEGLAAVPIDTENKIGVAIVLPEPARETEAGMVCAIANKRKSWFGRLRVNKPQYLVLEGSRQSLAADLFLCAWDERHAHYNFGQATIASVDDFIRTALKFPPSHPLPYANERYTWENIVDGDKYDCEECWAALS